MTNLGGRERERERETFVVVGSKFLTRRKEGTGFWLLINYQ